MNATLDRLKVTASALSAEERADLAHYLLGTLDPDEEREAEELWSELAAERLAEIRAGKVQGIPAEEVLRDLLEPAS